MDAALQIQGLDLRYGKNSASALSIPKLDLSQGKTIGISGPSGSGKSSFLYLISGLLKPTSGNILWSGNDVTQLSETACDQWRRENIGFFFKIFI